MRGFPGDTVVIESTCTAGDIRDMGSIPGSGRSPGGGNGNPLQHCCLENSMDRGNWWAIVYGAARGRTWLSTRAQTFMRRVTTEDCFPSEHYKFLCLDLGLPLVMPPTGTTGDESRKKSSCLRQVDTCQRYLRPDRSLKSNSWHQKGSPGHSRSAGETISFLWGWGEFCQGCPVALALLFYIQNVSCRWLWSFTLRDSYTSLSISEVPFVFCFVEMCTKLYNEDEFQPYDPSQEPIFPPELIVRYFTFFVL